MKESDMSSVKTEETSTPAVSVVIPCFNYGRYLLDAIDSVLDSTFRDLEILVVDDGSTDPDTRELLANLDRPRTRVIFQANKRLSGARNTGFSQARGEFVLPLDADDAIHPTLIEKAYWVLKNRPEVGFVSFWLEHFGDEDWIWRPESFNFYRLLFANSVTVTSLVRREAWEKSGGYDEKMTIGYEDWDFWIRLGAAGWKGHQIPEPLFRYRKHGVSMITAAQEKHVELVAQIKRNHPEIYTQTMLKRLHLIWEEGRHPDEVRRLHVVRAKRFARRTLKHLIPPRLRPRVIHHIHHTKLRIQKVRDQIRSWQGQQSHHAVVPAQPDLSFLEKMPTCRPDGRKRILCVFPWLEMGGADKVNLDILRGLAPDEYQITIVTTLPSSNPWWGDFQGLTNDIYCLANYGVDPGLHVEIVSRLIETRGVDLLFVSNSDGGYSFLPTLKARFPDLATVALVHNFVPEAPWDHARSSVSGQAFIDRIVCITQGLENTLQRHLGAARDRLVTIPNAVDTTVFQPTDNHEGHELGQLGVPDNCFIVGFIGRLSAEKGIDRFIRIAKRVMDGALGDRIHFVIIGDGPAMHDCIQQVRDLNLDGKVTLTGPRQDIHRMLPQIDLLVAPSEFEGLPILGLEAMACGTPILASEVVGWKDLIQADRTGVLVDVQDESGFASKIEWLLERPERRREITREARQFVLANHDMVRFQARYRSLFDRLIASNALKSRALEV
jgi:glycosyltransferase involved in cell wall biosynthesis